MMNKGIKGQKMNTNADKLKDFFLENIARYCDKCGKAYEDNELEILQQNEYSTIIHFECKNCKARNIATFLQPLGITSRIPVTTDLSVGELTAFVSKNALSYDEVLDVHELLKSSNILIKDLQSNSKSKTVK